MNEVLSMFLVTVDDKVAAYWGFSNYVLRNKLFFNSTGLMAKLSKFTTLIKILMFCIESLLLRPIAIIFVEDARPGHMCINNEAALT